MDAKTKPNPEAEFHKAIKVMPMINKRMQGYLMGAFRESVLPLFEKASEVPAGSMIVSRDLLDRLAKIEDIGRDEDNGPGRNLCPVCYGHGQWNWTQGHVVSIDPIEHERDCPLAELRAMLGIGA